MKRDKFIADFPIIRQFIQFLTVQKYQEEQANPNILLFVRKFLNTEIVVTIHADGSLAIRGYDLKENREMHSFDTGTINPLPDQLNAMLHVFGAEQDEAKFKLIFNEKEPQESKWSTISEELFPDYPSALKRFVEAVKVSFNTCNSINYLLIDNLDGDKDDLANFTIIQQNDILYQERHL